VSEMTNFVQTKSGRVHSKFCGIAKLGTANHAMTLDEVVTWVRRHGVLDGKWSTVSVSCCGASPESWLKFNHGHTYALLVEDAAS